MTISERHIQPTDCILLKFVDNSFTLCYNVVVTTDTTIFCMFSLLTGGGLFFFFPPSIFFLCLVVKILLIEDNRAISKGLVYTLEQNGFEVALCENAESTLNSLGGDFDLFIVDVSLPDGNGFELCDEIKRVCETPVIFLTALDDEDSIVKGFDLGAEDYITKPFSSRELLARIKRITKKLDKTMAMNFGDISIDFDKKQVCKNGNPVVLTALEYRLFAMLAKNSGKVLTREQILERIWDLSGNYVEDNTLTVYIKRLRKKLDTNMIKTVKGLGYRLEV